MRHWRKLTAPLLGAVALAYATTASAVINVPGDHYLCYKVKVAKFPTQSIPKPVAAGVSLTDQFETRIYDVPKITVVCLPGTKTHNANVFPPATPNVHLVGYQVKLSKVPPQKEDDTYGDVDRDIFNQFAAVDMGPTHNIAVSKPDSILVQSLKYDNGVTTKCSAKSDPCPGLGKVCDGTGKICIDSPLPTLGTPPDPNTSGVNNYKCYKIKDNKNPLFTAITSLAWSDQFGSRNLQILKPTKICTPVDKAGDGISDANVHLMCYQAKLAVGELKFAARKVLTKNDNFNNAWLDATGVSQFCVPSYKGEIPAPQPEPGDFFDFTTDLPDLVGCISGNSFDSTVGGSTIKDLHCGGLNLGGGPSTVAEGGTPDGATSRFEITGCVGSSCTFGPTLAAGAGFECTNTGCNFGPPLPVFSGGTSTCVLNTFSAPGGGTVDVSSGVSSSTVPLTSAVFLTSNATAPCPRCIAGTCQTCPTCFDGANGQCTAAGVPFACCTGAQAGTGTGSCAPAACTETNSFDTTHDCRPRDLFTGGNTPLGTIPVDLTPLTTALAMKDDSGGGVPGDFCPGQDAANKEGCFGSGACRRIEDSGIASGPITKNAAPISARLASVFCIPATGNALIDATAGLPGPGATSLPGFVSLHD
jgi:hypothetical protein